MTELIEVRLLGSARVDVRAVGKVKAFLINEDYQVKSNKKKMQLQS